MDIVVNEDILLMMLDRDPHSALQHLRESGDLRGLAVATTYGLGLPVGKKWGGRAERALWNQYEDAKALRREAAEIVISVCKTEAQLMRFYRYHRHSGSRSPLLKSIIRRWHESHDAERMAL